MRVMLILIYLAAIVAANLLVAAFGPTVVIVNALLFIGLDLTTRDALHEAWRGRWLVLKMAALIGAGSVLSYALNASAGRVALASFAAFALSATADGLTYAALGRRAPLVRINGSNMIGAAVDSIVFPALAFGWPLLWAIMLGQFAAKVVGGAAWSIVLTQLARVRHERRAA